LDILHYFEPAAQWLKLGKIPLLSASQRLQPFAAMRRTLANCHQAVTGHDDHRKRKVSYARSSRPSRSSPHT